MKNLSYLVSLVLLGSSYSISQTEVVEGPLDIGTGLGYNHPQIEMLNDGMPGVIWTSGGFNDLYFSKYDGAGAFTVPVQLNPVGLPALSYNWSGPDLAVEGDNVFVAFKENDYENGGIYLVKSTDNGNNWSDTVRIDNLSSNFGVYPDIAVLNDTIYVAFLHEDAASIDPQYVVTRSTDGGATFESEVPVTSPFGDQACECCQPEIIVNDNYVIVFFRNNQSNIRDIKAVVSYDRGVTFTDLLSIDEHLWVVTTCPSTGADAHYLDAQTIVSMYRTKVGLDYKVFANEYDVPSLSTVNEVEIKSVTGNGLGLNYPQLSIEGVNIAVVFEEVEQSGDVFINVSATGITGLDSANALNVTDKPGTQSKPDIVLSGDVMHVIYADATSPSGVKYVKVLSSTIGMKEEQVENPALEVYPNPATDYFFLKSDSESEFDISIVDVSGSVVFKTRSFTKQQISIAELSAGTYIVRATDISSGILNLISLVVD